MHFLLGTTKFHCFNVHFDSLSFIYTNLCTFSYYVWPDDGLIEIRKGRNVLSLQFPSSWRWARNARTCTALLSINIFVSCILLVTRTISMLSFNWLLLHNKLLCFDLHYLYNLWYLWWYCRFQMRRKISPCVPHEGIRGSRCVGSC